MSLSVSYIHCDYFCIKRQLLKINYTVENFAFDQNVKNITISCLQKEIFYFLVVAMDMTSICVLQCIVIAYN